jgi:hypothetical protein
MAASALSIEISNPTSCMTCNPILYVFQHVCSEILWRQDYGVGDPDPKIPLIEHPEKEKPRTPYSGHGVSDLTGFSGSLFLVAMQGFEPRTLRI